MKMNHDTTLAGVSGDRNVVNRERTTAFERLSRIVDDAGKTTSNLEMINDDDSDASETSDDSEDEEEEDDYALWEGFVMSCNRGGRNIFEKLEDMIDLYKWSERDELFQQLMRSVEWAKENNYSLSDAFNFAVHANKTTIVATVANCQPKDDDFWCALASRDVQSGCKWFTGDNCDCAECIGTSLLTKVRRFVAIFYGMHNDEIIQKILHEVDERSDDTTVDEAIEESIQQHKEEILVRYQQACDLIELCNIRENYNRPKFRWKEEMLEE